MGAIQRRRVANFYKGHKCNSTRRQASGRQLVRQLLRGLPHKSLTFNNRVRRNRTSQYRRHLLRSRGQHSRDKVTRGMHNSQRASIIKIRVRQVRHTSNNVHHLRVRRRPVRSRGRRSSRRNQRRHRGGKKIRCLRSSLLKRSNGRRTQTQCRGTRPIRRRLHNESTCTRTHNRMANTSSSTGSTRTFRYTWRAERSALPFTLNH